MRRPTISTLAKELGVSKMTISRVINDRPGVSAKLRAQIRQVIEDSGYAPSPFAQNLASGRSGLIGILVPDVVSEWISPLLLGVGEEANALGFQVLIRSTGRGISSDHKSQKSLVESSLTDGMIIASWRVPAPVVERLAQRHVPVVLVDGYFRSPNIPWVSSSFREGAAEMVRYLAEIGHERIAFLSGGAEPYVALEQLGGFYEGLAETGIPEENAWVFHGDYLRESGYKLGRDLLSSPERPTAIFAANDPMAVGVLQAAHHLGLSIPEDLSVVGFDDTLGAKTVPQLTSMLRDLYEIGRQAMRVVIDQLEDRTEPGEVVQLDLPTRLIVRQSSAPPKK
ncbi:MAG: LacI family transcriptional regulator [Chloroflexi bacterium]|nr:LacI family transcriptional regulator [Chloroflexota bacterium]